MLATEKVKIYGPYKRKDGRKHVILYNFALGIRRTVSYPKFLMQQSLGRELLDNETVDHIDEDITNDDMSNLQILSRVDNIKKSANYTGNWFECPNCKTKIYRPKCRMEIKIAIFCSNTCRSKTLGNQYQINARVAQLVGGN